MTEAHSERDLALQRVDEFQQFVDIHVRNSGVGVTPEIEAAVKKAVLDQHKHGRGERSVPQMVNDAIQEAKALILQGEKLGKVAANDIEDQTKQLAALDRGFLADVAVSAGDAIKSAVESVARVVEPGIATLVNGETKEVQVAYAAEKAVMPLRELANSASSVELAGRSQETDMYVQNSVQAAKAVREQQQAELQATTGDTLYPAGAEGGGGQGAGVRAATDDSLASAMVKPRSGGGGEFSAGQKDAQVPLTR